jgi:PTH1 family peptidyl-tRNA hydrolase
VSEFFLVAGLGNPGPRYTHNRHNIGFQALDVLAQAHGLDFTRTEHRAQTAHGTIAGRRIILAKPQTWMNESGKAIAPLSRFYKIEPEHILVIYDDLDIPLGTIRYRPEGSSGGHRGVQSIMQLLGIQTLPRLRLGIGRPPGQMDPAAYVLQDFSEADMSDVWDVLRMARGLIEEWLGGAPDFLRQGMTWRITTDANA